MKCFVNLMSLAVLLVFLVASLFSRAFAEQKPLDLSTDARIEVVAYSPNNVVPVEGSNLVTTQITFSPNEYIENVENGDLGAWTASINPSLPNMMFIKPTVEKSNTNMTVVTNLYTYYFQLMTLPSGGDVKDVTYAIHFIYPEMEREKVQKQIADMETQKQAELSAFQNPQNYNWNYSFSGDTSLVPLHVFDDGQFTYFQMQSNQSIPAIFAVTDQQGDESVVNYRQDGSYLVVQRVAPQFTLRLGANEVASIFNNTAIAQMNVN